MSRRLYRSMAQARSSLNQCVGTTLSADEQTALSAETKAAAALARAKQADRALVVHPVIARTGKPFRVERLFRHDGRTCREDIGEALTVEVATMIMQRELWRAQVFSDTGLVRADNFHDMERR